MVKSDAGAVVEGPVSGRKPMSIRDPEPSLARSAYWRPEVGGSLPADVRLRPAQASGLGVSRKLCYD